MMNKKDLQRLKELSSHPRGAAFAERTEDEEIELEELIEKRHEDQVLSIPVPTCCNDIIKYPPIRFYINGDSDTSKTEGVWAIALDSKLSEPQRAGNFSKWYAEEPAPKFCPYCAKALPKMKRKKPKPEDICKITDGGHHCDTCNERLMSCICLPPEAAWEEEK